MTTATVQLSDEECDAIVDAVSHRTHSYADGFGPFAGVASSAELEEIAAFLMLMARVARAAETGIATPEAGLVVELREAETYFSESVQDDRRALERLTTATDPAGYCDPGQTLDGLRTESAEYLAKEEGYLAAVRSVLARIGDEGGDA